MTDRGRMRSFAHALGNTAVFLAGLAAGCWSIGAVLPFPEVPIIKAKLEHFRRHADEYDTLFLGTSRIYHQILPSAFDELTRSCGLKTRSLNLAVDSLRAPEINYFIDQLLAARPKNLRWVFIETSSVRVPVDENTWGTLRAIYWHDAKRMNLLIRTALAKRKPPKKNQLLKVLDSYSEPLWEISRHVPLFARNVTNLGRASVLTQYLSDVPPYDDSGIVMGPHHDGFFDTLRGEQIEPRHRLQLEQGVADRRAKPAEPDYADPMSQRAFEGILEAFEKVGATTVQVIPPTTARRKFHVASNQKTGRIVFDYSDVEKYAALYEARHRVDTDHLNHGGAELFTRVVAEEFCAAAAKAKR